MWFNLSKLFKKEDIGQTAEDLFKESKEADVNTDLCEFCKRADTCKLQDSDKHLCGFIQELPDFNPDKPSILLFDDNYGVVSFLEDDLLDLDKDNKIDLINYNVLKFSSQYAAFNLQATLKYYGCLNIEYAIFDLTLGGGIYDETQGNIVLDGVDAFISTKELNENMRYIFFTGNKLNPYINKNQDIMQKFKEYSGDDIQNHILYKTSLSPDNRKTYIEKFLKNEELPCFH